MVNRVMSIEEFERNRRSFYKDHIDDVCVSLYQDDPEVNHKNKRPEMMEVTRWWIRLNLEIRGVTDPALIYDILRQATFKLYEYKEVRELNYRSIDLFNILKNNITGVRLVRRADHKYFVKMMVNPRVMIFLLAVISIAIDKRILRKSVKVRQEKEREHRLERVRGPIEGTRELKIITHNVNVIMHKKDMLARMLNREKPDVLLLQETAIEQRERRELYIEAYRGIQKKIDADNRGRGLAILVGKQSGLTVREVGRFQECDESHSVLCGLVEGEKLREYTLDGSDKMIILCCYISSRGP